jgi:tRNA threonylcarbamoyladenosine biosynthesis protein TsaB
VTILAFELSSFRGNLAVADRGDIVHESDWPNDRRDSSSFFAALETARDRVRRADLIVVGLGPGSYAGTRIALSTAVGLALVWNAKLVGYSSLCALPEASCQVIGDARRNAFYFARVENRILAAPPEICSAAELQRRVRDGSAAVTIEPLPQFRHARIVHPSAVILAGLVHQQHPGATESPREPIYLRAPHITTPRAST